jgi:hypothetical protein
MKKRFYVHYRLLYKFQPKMNVIHHLNKLKEGKN